MNITIKTHLAAAALCLTALLATGCTQDDLAGQPAGSIPLSIGSVSIAGTETAGTRAAITENAAGYTGIRKTRFVDGDELQLNVSDANGASLGTPKATLTGGKWVLDAPVYVTPGSTRISIQHQGTVQVPDILTDDLGTKDYTLNGQQLNFSLEHKNAMIDVTAPADITLTSVSLRSYDAAGNPKTYVTTTEEAADGTHYRAILASSLKVDGVTAVVGGQSYLATFAAPITLAANKRYPVALTFKKNVLSATIDPATLDWGTGDSAEIVPDGYTVYLRTPEDLAQFAKDVNDGIAGTGASIATVLQLADIDLSQLKTLDEAKAAYPDKSYTYTATADNWVAIDNFKGAFNGNGYTISNLKSADAGLFGSVTDAKLIGIHLREVNLSDANVGAPLAGSVTGSTVALCSVTGSVKVTGKTYGAGFVVKSKDSYYTRCSINLNMLVDTTLGDVLDSSAGGFIAVSSNDVMAACTVSGTLNFGDCMVAASGFVATGSGSTFLGCSVTGTLTRKIAGSYAFTGNTGATVSSCYAISGTNFSEGFAPSASYNTYKACAYMGTQSTAVAGITGDVAAADLYKTLTLGNASTATSVPTLHWSKADGYTLTEVSEVWGAPGIWKDNGASAPTMNMTYEGGLSYPAPIAAGNSVYEVNGYWVTAPDKDEDKLYKWNSDGAVSTMESDPCAGNGDWKMPTMIDFQDMAGWTDSWPWSQSVGTSHKLISTDTDAWDAAFPGGYYWSSVERVSYPSEAWIIFSDWEKKYYNFQDKTNSAMVRCVQKKK